MGSDRRSGAATPHRWRLALVVASSVLVLVVVAFLAIGPGTVGGVTISRSPGTDATTSASGAEADATRPSQADSIKDLVAQYGEPPDATFARLKIPKLGIDAGVSPRVVSGAVMPTPDGPENIAWYDMSAFPGLGGAPGAGHNAIFGAHVDFNNHVDYADRHFIGPAIFFHLNVLVPGDIIEVDYQGQVLKYQVTWAKKYPSDWSDWASIWSGDVKVDSITLFTCGGTFDYDSHSYSDRFVVRAERVSS